MANDTLIQSTTLTAIADAIREKTETSDVMYPSEMAGKIKGISGGIPVPDPIVAGDSIIKQTDTQNVAFSQTTNGYVNSGVKLTMKKSGTYRFTLTDSADDGESGYFRIRLCRNGTEITAFASNSSIGDKRLDGKITLDVTCEAGDVIEPKYRLSKATTYYIYNLTAGITLDTLNNDIF